MTDTTQIRIRCIRAAGVYSWCLCKPRFSKDGSPKLTKEGGHYYEPFAWFATPEQALRRLFDMLLGDGLQDEATYVDAVLDELHSIKAQFVKSYPAEGREINWPL